MIRISKCIICKEIIIERNEISRNIIILAHFAYIQSFDKFDNFIAINISKNKTCIKTISLNIYNTGGISEIAECFSK